MRALIAISALLLVGIPVSACDRMDSLSITSTPSSQPLISESAPSGVISANSAFDQGAAQEMLRLVNQARAQAGEPALVLDEALSQAAQAHALQLLEHGSISHQFEGESELGTRLGQANLRFDQAGENVALDFSTPHAHQMLMASEAHRQNLLNANFNAVGIAVVWDRCQMYVVQDFARRLPSYETRQAEDVVAERVSALRHQTRLPQLTRVQGSGLTDAACSMAKRGDMGMAKPSNARYVVSYSNSQPAVLPTSVSNAVSNGRMRNFSVGACYERSEKHPSGTYFVTMMFY